MKIRYSIIAIITLHLLLSAPQQAISLETEPSVPSYKLNRADEDYRYLKDGTRRIDFWDPIKYLPFNDRGDWYLSLGGEARERYEYFDNYNWKELPRDNGYALQRFFFHGDVHFGANVRLFGQFQSSLENGRSGGPRPSIDKDELDLHQGFLDLSMKPAADATLTLRSGRQELAYGSQRIIAVREGPNVRQSFDGFRLMYRLGDLAVDGIATRPVKSNKYTFDDGTDPSQALWGVYSVFPLPPATKGKADLYYLGLYRGNAAFDQGHAKETRHSVGARLWRTERPLDYNFEFLYQWGKFGDGDISAWTVASDTGYSPAELPFSPRFALKVDIASGDQDPNNHDLQTFNPLFPKGAYFSEDGLIGPANFININPSIELHLPKDVTLTANWDFFWRESIHDGIYNNAVVLVRSGKNTSARYIGSQPQLQFEWDVQRHITIVAIYAHFLAGPFLRESGPGEDVDYVTTWVTYKF
ncbi:alginate export family protein [Geomesophilobacter sediminis]|uniref:Alginate export family protein n=1 Tax=Geomesophilobacter sediminis TaxID=2798584 RepID=A0A8J7J6J3_9BACT|nr:alginate export family protein [Geomesophilobacter sediminis]MBJ6724436.1 alginate export family protein [Geomesophilobacter sediminis]